MCAHECLCVCFFFVEVPVACVIQCLSRSESCLVSVDSILLTSSLARAGDYHSVPIQWTIGVTSIFARAVGIAPTKDNYWSTSVQPGNPFNKTEPYPRIQAAVSTLSAGPVAPSDMIGGSNPQLIMQSCMSDGTLLQVIPPVRSYSPHWLSSTLLHSTPSSVLFSTSPPLFLSSSSHIRVVLSSSSPFE